MSQNVFQFIDVQRVDPPKKPLKIRKIQFVEIYEPFNQAQVGGNRLQMWKLGLITGEFFFIAGVIHCPRIFEAGAQGGVGEAQAAVVAVVFQLGDDAETLRIAFKGLQIEPLQFG